MSTIKSEAPLELKIVILAAGAESGSNEPGLVLLRNLGGRKVIDHVIQNALQAVTLDDIYIVVGRGDEDPGALGAQDVRTLLRRGKRIIALPTINAVR